MALRRRWGDSHDMRAWKRGLTPGYRFFLCLFQWQSLTNAHEDISLEQHKLIEMRELRERLDVFPSHHRQHSSLEVSIGYHL